LVGEGDFIDREIALEHAPAGAELLNAIGHKGPDGRGQAAISVATYDPDSIDVLRSEAYKSILRLPIALTPGQS
jgi:hypothetical protein